MLTERFKEALDYAFELHRAQFRKGTKISYLAHLLAVTALVIEDGGDESQSVAAILHDAVEDQGGVPILAEIQSRFGERVAKIVAECSDAYSEPKPPWKSRREAYLQHLKQAPLEVRRVSLADKLHNARSILRDLRLSGSQVWERFNGGKEGSLWYYRELLQVFKENKFSPMVDELEQIVREIERIASESE